MYISPLEVNQLKCEYLDRIEHNKIKIDIPLFDLQEEKSEDEPYFLKNELKEKLRKIINPYVYSFRDLIKSKIIYEIDRYFNEISEKDMICNFDEYFFYIFKEELGKLFGSKIEINIYESGKYQHFIGMLKEYHDDLNKILELKIDDIVKFVKMYEKLFEKVKEEKEYIYDSDKYFIVNAKAAGKIFKNCNFNENDIAFFNKITKKKKFSEILIFKDEAYLDEKKERISDHPISSGKRIENVYLLSKSYVKENKGTLFEVISYLYIRKILNRIKLLFLSTHNLLLKLRGSEEEIIDNINEKEIDIPIILYYEDRHIFIPIECKFKDLNNKDIQKLNQLKKKLNDIPIDNEICILTTNSNEISMRENVHVVPISKFEEWIKRNF